MTPTDQEAIYECECGTILSIPYRNSENIAPNYEIIKQLTEMVLQHLGKDCGYIFNEIRKIQSYDSPIPKRENVPPPLLPRPRV